MKTGHLIILYLLTMMLLGSTAPGQTGDWQAVKDLPPSTRIKVTLKHGHGSNRCIFKEATDDELACAVEGPGTSPLLFHRDNVRAVYLNPKPHHSAGGAPAVLAGAGLFVSLLTLIVVAGPVPILATAGGVGALYFITKPFLHGEIVYRSARHPSVQDRGADSKGGELPSLPPHLREGPFPAGYQR